jgi:hypothetical protein
MLSEEKIIVEEVNMINEYIDDILIQKYKEIKELEEIQRKHITDNYNCGLYNGLELALSVLSGEKPQFKVLGSDKDLCLMEKLGAYEEE